MLLTRSPLIHTNQKGKRFTVRLACVKHAASVRPEPGSNSPNKTNKTRPQPTTNKQPARTHSQYNSPENQTRPNPTPNTGPGKPKQNKTPKTTHNQNHAQPPGPWHKKHDTLSSSQTTHPPRTCRKAFCLSLRSQKRLRNFSEPDFLSQTNGR